MLSNWSGFITTLSEPNTIVNFMKLIVIIIILLEGILRIPTTFSFVRVTQREVNSYIKKFREDILTSHLDDNHYTDKINAGQLFQIAGWGTILVSLLTSMSVILQNIAMFLVAFSFPGNQSDMVALIFEYIFLIIIQIVTILPSILYLAFLILLWLYFRNKTRVKYSGYSSDDPMILKLIHQQEEVVEYTNQDDLHYTFYKHKSKVMVATYVVIILLITVMFLIFSVPILANKWVNIIHMKPGDYYELNGSRLREKECPNDWLFVSFENEHKGSSTVEPGELNCSATIFLAKYLHPAQFHYRTNNYTIPPYKGIHIFNSLSPAYEYWVPKNSTVQISVNIPRYYNYTSVYLKSIMTTKYPCYVISLHGYYDNSYGVNVCENPKIRDEYPIVVQYANFNNNSKQLNYRITSSGVYYVNSYSYYYPNSDANITISRYGRKVDEESKRSLTRITTNDLAVNDVILFQSPENAHNFGQFCTIKFSCNLHPALRVMVPISISLVVMVYLIVSIFLIHKI